MASLALQQWCLWSLGSSIEPREHYIKCAQEKFWHYEAVGSLDFKRHNVLQGIRKFKLIYKSHLVESAPYGKNAKNNFLNGLLLTLSSLSPEELLYLGKNVELLCGRTPGFFWADREIDIDLLLYGKENINLPYLKIPHPGINRDYIKPLLEETKKRINLFSNLPDWDEIFPFIR